MTMTHFLQDTSQGTSGLRNTLGEILSTKRRCKEWEAFQEYDGTLSVSPPSMTRWSSMTIAGIGPSHQGNRGAPNKRDSYTRTVGCSVILLNHT